MCVLVILIQYQDNNTYSPQGPNCNLGQIDSKWQQTSNSHTKILVF